MNENEGNKMYLSKGGMNEKKYIIELSKLIWIF